MGRGFPGGGQDVETTAWTIFAGRDERVFPAALQQPHALEAPEGTVQGAVCRQQTSTRDVSQALRELVPMKFANLLPLEFKCNQANRSFERNERARFSSHGAL